MTLRLKFILGIFFLIQVIWASGFELSHDEAYYWLFSKNLDFGYFDHPPMVAVVVRLFSFLGQSEISTRIGFIVLQLLGFLLIKDLVKNQFIAFFIYFSFPLVSLGSGLALPDGPLVFFTACYFWALNRYLTEDGFVNVFYLALSIALLLNSKYHGILLVFFTVVALPQLFIKRSFYLTFLISLMVFLPHLLWQDFHHYPTLKYHFLERPRAEFGWIRSGEYLLSQFFLSGFLIGPIIWWLLLSKKSSNPLQRVQKWVSLGTVVFFLVSSINKKVEANWTIFLAIPLTLYVADNDIWKKFKFRFLIYLSFGLILLLRFVLFYPADSIGIKRIKEFHGWKTWAKEVKEKCGELPVVANTYQISSKLSYYLKTDVPALNYRSRKNQFDLWKFESSLPTGLVCYITDKNEFLGESITSPEGKTLLLVKNQSKEALWKLKYSLK